MKYITFTAVAYSVLFALSANAAVSDAEFSQVQTDLFRVKTSMNGVQAVITTTNAGMVNNKVAIDALQKHVDDGFVNLNSKVNDASNLAKANEGKITALGSRVSAIEARPLPVDGKNGLDGKDGKDGAPGKDGANGKDGIDGKDGNNGKDGAKGDTGAVGAQGVKGDTGDKGDKGDAGKDGADGKDGVSASFDASKFEAEIQNLQDGINRVGALSMATSGLHYNGMESGGAVALGTYNGANAIAVGTQYQINTNAAATLQGVYDGKNFGASAGVHWNW